MGSAAAIGRAIRADLSKTIRDVMLLAADNVMNATPVDTGHAANNWVLSIGSPFTGIDGSREAPSNSAQQAGIAAMQSYDVGSDGKVFLRNNVFYVQYLDEGWSQQAPPNFVAEAFSGGVRRAPRGKKTAVRKMLRGMANNAYKKGY